eukprot:15165573-Alexandrium_andersonii.AAC.1
MPSGSRHAADSVHPAPGGVAALAALSTVHSDELLKLPPDCEEPAELVALQEDRDTDMNMNRIRATIC